MKIHYATISETGKRRKNEDAFRIVNSEDGNRWLAVVCDGMGGLWEKWQARRLRMP